MIVDQEIDASFDILHVHVYLSKNGARTARAWFLMRITADWVLSVFRSLVKGTKEINTGYECSRLVYPDFVTDFIEVDLWQV